MSVAVVVLIFLLLVVFIGVGVAEERRKVSLMSPEERAKYEHDRQVTSANRSAELAYGSINPQMICPHCQYKNCVRTMQIKKKAGISGGKATAAILTGGVSMLATGLSRKDKLTQAHCGNCNSTWSF